MASVAANRRAANSRIGTRCLPVSASSATGCLLVGSCMVPVRSGGGTRLKILEAMAAGVPVISTRLGAEGIDVQHDVHILLADSGAEIASAVHRIASSAETRSRLSRAAHSLVTTTYDWSMIGKRLHELHAELVESRASRSLETVS